MVAVPKPEVPAVDLASPAAAAAALRTFWKLAETWELSPGEQATLLGVGRTTLYQWKQGKAGSLDREQMLYCLFRHIAPSAFRDMVTTTGERVVFHPASPRHVTVYRRA